MKQTKLTKKEQEAITNLIYLDNRAEYMDWNTNFERLIYRLVSYLIGLIAETTNATPRDILHWVIEDTKEDFGVDLTAPNFNIEELV